VAVESEDILIDSLGDLEPLAQPISGLYEDPENARVHNARSTDAVAAMLRRVGQRKPIVAMPDGKVIAGNGTLRAAQILGWTKLAVVTWTLGEERARQYAIVDNRSGEKSRWDDVLLAKAMAQLTIENPMLAHEVGFNARELQVFVKAMEEIELPGSTSSEPTLATKISFYNEADQEIFYKHLKYLRDRFPDVPTHAGRLAAYIRTL
jgi:hypothetical protein